MLLVETSPDGAIVLRPATVAPIELYDEARVAEFLAEDALTPEPEARLERARNVRAKAPELLSRFAVVMTNVARVPEASVGLVADVGAELRPILAAAIACGADRLVTGDRRHFGTLFGAAVGCTAIASPREALGVLLETIGSWRRPPCGG